MPHIQTPEAPFAGPQLELGTLVPTSPHVVYPSATKCGRKHPEGTDDSRLAAVVRPNEHIHVLQRDREPLEGLEVSELH